MIKTSIKIIYSICFRQRLKSVDYDHNAIIEYKLKQKKRFNLKYRLFNKNIKEYEDIYSKKYDNYSKQTSRNRSNKKNKNRVYYSLSHPDLRLNIMKIFKLIARTIILFKQ